MKLSTARSALMKETPSALPHPCNFMKTDDIEGRLPLPEYNPLLKSIPKSLTNHIVERVLTHKLQDLPKDTVMPFGLCKTPAVVIDQSF